MLIKKFEQFDNKETTFKELWNNTEREAVHITYFANSDESELRVMRFRLDTIEFYEFIFLYDTMLDIYVLKDVFYHNGKDLLFNPEYNDPEKIVEYNSETTYYINTLKDNTLRTLNKKELAYLSANYINERGC